MNHTIEHLGKNQEHYQLEQQTTAMTKWDVVVRWFPIVSVFTGRRCEATKVVMKSTRAAKARMGTRQSLWYKAQFSGCKVPAREGKLQVVVQHGQCRYTSSGGSSRVA